MYRTVLGIITDKPDVYFVVFNFVYFFVFASLTTGGNLRDGDVLGAITAIDTPDAARGQSYPVPPLIG